MKDNKGSKNSIFKKVTAIIDYMVAVVFVVIFALYCSGRVGWFLLLILVLAPIISVLYAFLTSRYLTFNLSVNNNQLIKGGSLLLELSFTNPFPIPSPTIQVDILDSDHISCEDAEGKEFAIFPLRNKKVSFTLKAKLAGGSFVGIKKVVVKDFFGIASFEVKKLDGLEECKNLVGVLPHIAELYGEEIVLKEMMSQAFGDGDNDDTIDEIAYGFSGTPGYEYREYVPGDPIKRINSKLSAKRDKLYIRLDEKQAMTRIMLIMDPFVEAGDKCAVYEENVIEHTLGMIRYLISKDFAVRAFIYKGEEEGFEESIIVDEPGLNFLMQKLADYIFENKNEVMCRLPDIDTVADESIIVCTASEKSFLMSGQVQTLKANIESLGIFDVSTGEGRKIC